MNDVGLSPERQKRYIELMNRIGNLELLLSSENLDKSNQHFEHWLATRDSSFRRRHLIPNGVDLLRFDKFEEFFTDREELIRQRLKTIFLPQASPEITQPTHVPHDIDPDRQANIHRLLIQLVEERPELERDICNQEAIRFGVKDWDVAVLKAGTRWPPSGRILLFIWVNRKQTLNLQLGLGWGPEGTDTREKLFQMALSNQPPFSPPKYRELPPQWIYLYQLQFLNPQAYTDLSEEELETEIRKQWQSFVENDLRKLNIVLRAQRWIWQPASNV